MDERQFEFRLMPGDWPTTNEQLLDYLTNRQTQLRDIAEKLIRAGWPVELTLTGLAFDLPFVKEDGTEVDEDERDALFNDPDLLAQRLAAMGITERCEMPGGRTLPEVLDAHTEVLERVRYDRLRNASGGPNEEMQELEAKWDKALLEITSDFERGMVNGKLSALRWVLGFEWDFLDT